MKLKDIEVGQEYMIGRYPERVRVLEVGTFEKRVYSGYRHDFGGHKATIKGARVMRLSRREGEEMGEDIITPQRFNCLWSEHLEQEATAKKNEELRRQNRAAFVERLDLAGLASARVDPSGTSVTLSRDDILNLLTAYEQGA